MDIAFLDVEMPGISGIQVSAKLKQKTRQLKYLSLQPSLIIWTKQCEFKSSDIYQSPLIKIGFFVT